MKAKRKMTRRQVAVLGGKSGTGKAKARSSKVARAAAKARWDAYRAKKAAKVKIVVKIGKPEWVQLNARDYGAIQS